jgi:hypothetical protein
VTRSPGAPSGREFGSFSGPLGESCHPSHVIDAPAVPFQTFLVRYLNATNPSTGPGTSIRSACCGPAISISETTDAFGSKNEPARAGGRPELR